MNEVMEAANTVNLESISSEPLKGMINFFRQHKEDPDNQFQNWTDSNWSQWRDHSDASPW